jgi:hypothetical protein
MSIGIENLSTIFVEDTFDPALYIFDELVESMKLFGWLFVASLFKYEELPLRDVL